MSSLLNNLAGIIWKIVRIIRDCSQLIRTNPYLMFTIGFVVIGYCIVILGRLLSRD